MKIALRTSWKIIALFWQNADVEVGLSISDSDTLRVLQSRTEEVQGDAEGFRITSYINFFFTSGEQIKGMR